MANECMNYITIRGDKDLLRVFADSYLKKTYNNDSVDFNGDSLTDEKYDYGLDFNLIAPIPKNCENDYDFRIHNWGNKWDGTHGNVTFYDDEIFIDVSTAWGPCDRITYKLIELCPALNFYHEFYEGGEGFIGWIEHSENEGPDEYTDVEYHVLEDPQNYWFWTFEKEFENFDWLYEYIDDCIGEEEISEEEGRIIQNMIENSSASIEDIVRHCIEKGVLR